MRTRTVLFLLAALIVAGVTAFAARGWLNAQHAALLASMSRQEAPEVKVVEGVSVLVANIDLPTGHFIKKDDLGWHAWPTDSVNESYVVKGEGKIEDFLGSVVRTPVTGGEPITEARVVRPGDRGFLAAVLSPGMRAVSVKIDAISGVSGFVFPGDRVDVILTHKIKIIGLSTKKKDKGVTRRAAETVLNNVRVLALDQATHLQDGSPSVAKTATLEVTPKHAEMLKLTAVMGSLSLSLRSLANDAGNDDENGETQPARRADAAESGYRRTRHGDSRFDDNLRHWVAGGRGNAGNLVQVGEQDEDEEDEEAYGLRDPFGDMLDRFYRRDGRTYTWDAEVSQLLKPPVNLKTRGFEMHIGRGSSTQVYKYGSDQNLLEFFLEDMLRDKSWDEDKKKQQEDAKADMVATTESAALAHEAVR